MAPKSKTPAGELTAPELRKLIRAHNILSKIVIPKGTDREGLIKLIEGKNYKVDHKDKVIRPKQQRGKQITLKKAEELTKPKPVSEAVKKQRAEKKKEKEEEKKKDIKIAKKEAVQEFKQKKKEAGKLNKKKDLKIKSILINKKEKDMGETQFIKQQKKLQLEKQKETRRALLKAKSTPDKTTRRGKPVKSKELSKEEQIKQLEQSIAQKKKDVEVMKKKKEVKKEVKKEGNKIGRPKGAKTILNFSKLKKEGMERLFKELNIIGPYQRPFGTEDFTITQLRKWLKWLVNADEFSPLPETFKEVKGKDFNSIYPFYTFNWYSYPSNDKNERYYQRDLDTPERKKKYNLRVQQLKKEGKAMIKTYDDMYLNPENKNITKSDLIKKLNKFVEEEKKK